MGIANKTDLNNRVEALEKSEGSGTSNYNQLTNRPKINNNLLTGNKTSNQLGLASSTDIATEFSDLTNYNKGDLVYYEGSLYQFQVDHTAGAWESSEAIQKDLSDIINSIGGGSSDPGYSLSEVNTGKKWIDGKDIYRKVIKLYENGVLDPGITNEGNNELSGGFPVDIDSVISYNVPSIRPGSETYTDNMVGMGTNFSNNAVLRLDGRLYYNPGYTPVEAYCIVEYTKATSEELNLRKAYFESLKKEDK